jgi:hypothetical protein
VGGAGAYFATKNGVSGSTPPAQQGDTTPANGTAVPVVRLERELEDIAPMADASPESASSALTRLAALDSVARAADDTSFLHFRYLRGRALITTGEVQAGCDSMKNLEGRLTKTRWERAVKRLLESC